MKKIIFILVFLLILVDLGFSQNLDGLKKKRDLTEEEIKEKTCDVRLTSGKWRKYVILEFRDNGIIAEEEDLFRYSVFGGQSRGQFIEREDIERIFCNGEYYEFPNEFPEKKVDADNYADILKYTEKHRDPALAGILSFIFIGGGQYYNDQPGKGMFLILSQFAVVAIVFSNEPASLKPMDNPGIAIVMLSIIPIISMFDAVNSAESLNEKLKLKYKLSFRPEKKGISCGLTLNF